MRALLLGIFSSFFFAFTFVLNRMMDVSGGSWLWSASLRWFFMIPFLLVIVSYRGNLRPLFHELTARPWLWIKWSIVGFGLFYAPLCFAAAFGPGWLVAGTWQITIVAGSLLVPFMGGAKQFPLKGLLMSLIILAGVAIMQLQQGGHLSTRDMLLGIVPVVIAAFAYPLGNRKMMAAVQGRLDAYQRVLGMTVASLPLWIVLAVVGYFHAGAPSAGQTVQSLVVALTSGVIATVLFFSATDMVKGNVQQLAAVEATQSGEVVFAVLLEMCLLSVPLPSIWSMIGMFLVILGMILHSYVSHSKKVAKKESLAS